MIISIPFWSDFNDLTWDWEFVPGSISIPFWSDFNILLNDFERWLNDISIPFWSDFNKNKKVKVFVLDEFQSHFGLILTLWNFE